MLHRPAARNACAVQLTLSLCLSLCRPHPLSLSLPLSLSIPLCQAGRFKDAAGLLNSAGRLKDAVRVLADAREYERGTHHPSYRNQTTFLFL